MSPDDDAQRGPTGYSALEGKTHVANDPSTRAALIGSKDRLREIERPP